MSPRVVIYTDGGADPNPGIGGWGAVLIHEQTQETKEISGGEVTTTNNRMELTAALEALRSLRAPCEVELFKRNRRPNHSPATEEASQIGQGVKENNESWAMACSSGC